MPRFHNINGENVQFTAEEEAARDTEEQAWADGAEDRRVAATQNITFETFEARFTPQEWDDATDFVYAADLTTGKPKRRALVQGLARAQARNNVDLLDPKTAALLSILVSGGVITAARKAIILTP